MLAEYRGSYDYDDPQEYDVGLLFTAPDAVFLVRPAGRPQNTDEVWDAITLPSTAANERMDVVRRILPDRG